MWIVSQSLNGEIIFPRPPPPAQGRSTPRLFRKFKFNVKIILWKLSENRDWGCDFNYKYFSCCCFRFTKVATIRKKNEEAAGWRETFLVPQLLAGALEISQKSKILLNLFCSLGRKFDLWNFSFVRVQPRPPPVRPQIVVRLRTSPKCGIILNSLYTFVWP